MPHMVPVFILLHNRPVFTGICLQI